LANDTHEKAAWDNKNEESTSASHYKAQNESDGSSMLTANDMVGNALDGEWGTCPQSLLAGACVDISGLKAQLSPQLWFVLTEVAELFPANKANVARVTTNAPLGGITMLGPRFVHG
jgi:hypothetical protein